MQSTFMVILNALNPLKGHVNICLSFAPIVAFGATELKYVSIVLSASSHLKMN